MALGNSSIASAREELNVISSKVAKANSASENFRNLYQDENFKKFVEDTQKGAEIYRQLQALSEWSSSMCSTVSNMVAKSHSYLNRQESLNK